MHSENWVKFYTANNQNKTFNDTPKGRFFGAKAKSTTLEARAREARYTARKNICQTCWLAGPCDC